MAFPKGGHHSAKREGWPDQYTVLCMNCNAAKARLGACPHEER